MTDQHANPIEEEVVDVTAAAEDDGAPEDQLTLVEADADQLLDPQNFANGIADSLDALWQQGADEDEILAIQSNAAALLETTQQVTASFHAMTDIARTFRAQREDQRLRLNELQTAIENQDASVPEIERLIDEVLEADREEAQYHFWDMIHEFFQDSITDETPLTYSEALRLVARLTNDATEIEPDHFLWFELREWITRCDAYVRTGVTPPSEVESDG